MNRFRVAHVRQCAREYGGLLAVLFPAAVLRFHGLARESVWWDEYASIAYLDAPSFTAFFQRQLTWDPAAFPLYYFLEYLWWHHVDASAHGLRLLSVVLGLVAVMAVFLAVRSALGRHAGLIAALCIALSPVHIFDAQGIRAYVAVTFFAALSLWTYFRLLHAATPGRWAAHALVNGLLLWTHPFAVLAPVAEGAALLVGRVRRVRFWLAWGLLQALLAAPVAIYLTRIRYFAGANATPWLQKPDGRSWFLDTFADDVLYLFPQLPLSSRAGAWLPSSLLESFVRWTPTASYALLATGMLAVIFGLLQAFRGLLYRRRDMETAAAVTALLWLVLPSLALFLFSHLWRPAMLPRYTVFASLGLYLLTGALIAKVPVRGLRNVAISLLIGLYAWQLMLVYPGPLRTNWADAAALLREQSAPERDMVVVTQSIGGQILAWYLDEAPIGVLSRDDRAEALALGLLFLAHAPRAEKPPSLYLVSPSPVLGTGPDDALESLLADHGLPVSRTHFPGLEDLDVYRVRTLVPPPTPTLSDDLRDYVLATVERFIRDGTRNTIAVVLLRGVMTARPEEAPAYARLLDALEQGSDAVARLESVRALQAGHAALMAQDSEKARHDFTVAIQHDPDCLACWQARAPLDAEAEDLAATQECLAALKRLLPAHEYESQFAYREAVAARGGSLREAIQVEAEAMGALQELESGNPSGARARLRALAVRAPDFHLRLLLEALCALEEENLAQFAASIRGFFAAAPAMAALWSPLVEALFFVPDCVRAQAEKERLEAASIALLPAFESRWAALCTQQ